MIRTLMVGGDAASEGQVGAPDGRRRRTTASLQARARLVWEWLTSTGYRPERRYMRGGGDNRQATGHERASKAARVEAPQLRLVLAARD
jgi:hypothetical protein